MNMMTQSGKIEHKDIYDSVSMWRDPGMTIEALIERRRLRRKVQGIAAALLPYEADGSVAVEAFEKHLADTHRAGLMNAVNMDTGYVNYLTDAEKQDVLRWTREALGDGVPFVAGAYIENQAGDIVTLYRQQIEPIVCAGGIPISDGSAARGIGERKGDCLSGGVPGLSERIGF
jgi:hypothetical protein